MTKWESNNCILILELDTLKEVKQYRAQLPSITVLLADHDNTLTEEYREALGGEGGAKIALRLKNPATPTGRVLLEVLLGVSLTRAARNLASVWDGEAREA